MKIKWVLKGFAAARLTPQALTATANSPLIFRVESSLLYFNAEHVASTVLAGARAEGDG